jgi:hypothetical protein
MNEEQKTARGVPVPKGSRRPWVAGKPKFTNGYLQKVMVLLSNHQVSFLKRQGNLSAAIRDLVEKEMARSQKRSAKA